MTLVELTTTLGLVVIAGGWCVANIAPETTQVQEEAAARFLVAQIRQVRHDALQRATTVGVRFERGDHIQFRAYVDGNNNGLRTRDIDEAIDVPLGPARRLEDDFGGAGFGVARTLPPIDAGGDRLAAGDDPIHVGSSRIVSFGANGRGSSGTLYVRGRGGQQFAVRIFGQTGRVRLLQYRVSDGQWIER
jgi:hypothetical protein